LFVRTAPGAARRALSGHLQTEQERVDVLRSPAAGVPEDHLLVDLECEEGRDAPQAAQAAHSGLGQREAHSPVDAPGLAAEGAGPEEIQLAFCPEAGSQARMRSSRKRRSIGLRARPSAAWKCCRAVSSLPSRRENSPCAAE